MDGEIGFDDSDEDDEDEYVDPNAFELDFDKKTPPQKKRQLPNKKKVIDPYKDTSESRTQSLSQSQEKTRRPVIDFKESVEETYKTSLETSAM